MNPSEPASTSADFAATRRGSHDVLADVVALYLRAPGHEKAEIRSFAALVGGLLDGADAAARRRVSLALATRPDTPPEIARRLATDSIDVAEAMIIASPVLTSTDLVEVMRRGPEHVRCVTQRLDLAPDIAAVLVDTTTPGPLRPMFDPSTRRRTDVAAAPRPTTSSPIPSRTTPEPAPMTETRAPSQARTAPKVETGDTSPPPLFRVPVRETPASASAPPRPERSSASAPPRPLSTDASVLPRSPATGSSALPRPATATAPDIAPALARTPAQPRERTAAETAGHAFLALDSAGRWRALQAAALDTATRATPPRGGVRDPLALGDRLLAAAVAGDHPVFVDALIDDLGLGRSLVEAITAEPSGEALAIVLVACGIGDIRATSILLHHLGATASLGTLQDLVALVERSSRRSAEQLVLSWREDRPLRRASVQRQTDDAERRETAGSPRETGVGETRTSVEGSGTRRA